jgi:adenylate cyclase
VRFYNLVAAKIPEQVIREVLSEVKTDGARSPEKLFTYKIKQYALERARGEFELAQQAVRLNPSLPYGHQQLAYLYVYRGQHAEAIAAAREAVKLGGASNTAGAVALAQTLIYAGQPDQAITLMEDAIRRDPRAPAYYFYHLGQAFYVMRQYQQAEHNLQEALRINPNFRPARSYLVAVYSEVGRDTEAQAEMATLLGMGRPRGVQNVRRVAPYKDATIRERLLAAWQKAGAPVNFSPFLPESEST